MTKQEPDEIGKSVTQMAELVYETLPSMVPYIWRQELERMALALVRDAMPEKDTKIQEQAARIAELEQDYQRIIKEVMDCQPLAAHGRSEDVLEPPWDVIARVRLERDKLKERIAELEQDHCKDCCCARSWVALGITTHTNMSIPEHIEALRAERDKLKAELAGYQYHEAQTHVKLGAILGTDDSLEVLAWRLQMDLRTARQDAREFARAIREARNQLSYWNNSGARLGRTAKLIRMLESVDTSNYVDGGERHHHHDEKCLLERMAIENSLREQIRRASEKVESALCLLAEGPEVMKLVPLRESVEREVGAALDILRETDPAEPKEVSRG